MPTVNSSRDNFLKLILNNNNAKMFFKNERTKKLITDFKAAFKNSSNKYSDKLARSLDDIKAAIDNFDETKNDIFLVKEFNQFFSRLPDKANDMRVAVNQLFKHVAAPLDLFTQEGNFDNLMKLVPEVMGRANSFITNIKNQISKTPDLISENDIVENILNSIEDFKGAFVKTSNSATGDVQVNLKKFTESFSTLLMQIKNLAKQD